LFRRPAAFRWRSKTTLENGGTHVVTEISTTAAGNRERFVLHPGATVAPSSSTRPASHIVTERRRGGSRCRSCTGDEEMKGGSQNVEREQMPHSCNLSTHPVVVDR